MSVPDVASLKGTSRPFGIRRAGVRMWLARLSVKTETQESNRKTSARTSSVTMVSHTSAQIGIGFGSVSAPATDRGYVKRQTKHPAPVNHIWFGGFGVAELKKTS